MATKEGLEPSIATSVECREKVESNKEEKQGIGNPHSEPIPGTSGQFKLILRKDLFDETPSKSQKPILEKADNLNQKNKDQELPLSDPIEISIDTRNMDENVSPLTPPHDDSNRSKLREVDSTPPGKLMLPTYFVFIESSLMKCGIA